ncbi:MAG: TOMM precursor leader peptide-binding protein [Micromonosporaceae bacterium]|nr:TOMM precursor leader peptide-binding protein [Micromonosporaceae bacterium]
MKPKLRTDCVYVPVGDEGVFLQTAFGSIELAGASSYRLVERIAPYLDGSRSLDDLLSGLTGERRDAVARLIETLVVRGLAHDVERDRPHGLTDAELQRYAAEISFVEQSGGAAEYRFERFRLSQPLLIGGGAPLAALVRVLLRLGLRCPTVLPVDAEPGLSGALHQCLAAARATDPQLNLRILPGVPSLPSVGELGPVLAGYDAVLHCDDRAQAGTAVELARAAREAGMSSLHAMVLDAGVLVGPVTGDQPYGCWECVWLRHCDAVAASRAPGGKPSAPLSGPMAGLVAGVLGSAYLASVGGVTTPGESHVSHIDLDSANTTTHTFFPHPRCATCRPAATARAAPSGTDTPVTGADALAKRAAVAVDWCVGLISRLDEGDHEQYPQRVVDVTVAATHSGPQTVRAVGATRQAARLRAVVAGLELAADLPATTGPQATAAGLSWPEAVGRAVLRLMAQTLPTAAVVPPPGQRMPFDGGDDQQLRMLADAARLRGADLRLATHDGAFATAVVFDGETPLWTTRATTASIARRTAVEAAVARLYGHQVAGFDIPPDLGEVPWSEACDALLASLDRTWQIVAQPAERCAASGYVLPFVATVTLEGDGRP